MIELKNNPAGNFFLLAGPCVIEGEEMAMRIAERIVTITENCNPLCIQRVVPQSQPLPPGFLYGHRRRKGAEDTAKSAHHLRSTYRDRHSCSRRSHHGCRICGYSANSRLPLPADRPACSRCQNRKTINIKKGQFLSPLAMRFAADKVVEAGNRNVMLTERGTTFGYQDLVIDYRGIPEMQTFGFPVILDVTHSLQQPNQTSGVTGGMPQLIETVAKAGVAVGVDGLFIETHENPAVAKSDGANMLKLDLLEDLLTKLVRIREAVR